MGKFKSKLKQISADSIEKKGASDVGLLKALMERAAEKGKACIDVYKMLSDEAIEWLKYEGFHIRDRSSVDKYTEPRYRIEW